MLPPKWAQNLMLEALIYLESKGFKVSIPELKWRHGFNSGSYCPQSNRIVVSAGKRQGAKLTLLHEIAHSVTPGSHHNDCFWDITWDLYKYFKLPIRYCLKREGNYREGAIKAYKRSKHINRPHSIETNRDM